MTHDSHDSDDFSKALVFSARLPLAWQTSVGQLDESAIEDNEACLRTVLLLSEYHGREHGEELAALEHKVDITLDMVASLLRASIAMPGEVSVQLGAHELSWLAEDTPDEGEAVSITLYLHDLYPKPLSLAGAVIGKTDRSCTVELTQQSEEVQHLLEKFIFLHHRRAIAHRKSG